MLVRVFCCGGLLAAAEIASGGWEGKGEYAVYSGVSEVCLSLFFILLILCFFV